MTAEQRCFLNVISDYINDVPSVLPDEQIDLAELAKIARYHSLAGIIYAQCKDFLPKENEAVKLLENAFTSSVFYYVCNNEALAELRAAYAAAGINLLAFKGLNIAKYHPVPELRTMGDIDVLIHASDREKSHKLMLGLGYKCDKPVGDVWKYKRDVVEIEVHEHIAYERLGTDFNYINYFDCAWDYNVDGSLSPNLQFLHTVEHTAKHMLVSGSGFRPFLDMAFMAKLGALDWDFICVELDKIELLEFAKVCFALCNKWFGVEFPIEHEDISDELFDEITEKTFSDGVFGNGNKENFGAHIASEFSRKEDISWVAAIVIWLRMLFPNVNTMPQFKVYSFLFDHKLLRPIAWIYRIVYCGVNRFSNSVKLFFYPLTKRKKVKNRLRYLRNLKLIK